MDLEESRK